MSCFQGYFDRLVVFYNTTTEGTNYIKQAVPVDYKPVYMLRPLA